MTDAEAPRMRGEVLGEASRWFVELEENPQDETVRRAFDRWLRRSPEHVHAFLQVSMHWEEGTPRPSAAVESVSELVALARSDSNVVSFAHSDAAQFHAPKEHDEHERAAVSGGQGGERGDRAPETPRLSRGWRLAVAASVLLSLAAVLAWHQFLRGVYSTGVGEQRSLTLADGSTVELNSRTRIRVTYTSQERHIDLLEGQALFKVAKNQSHPFIVQSRNTQVRAVGTQFDVYRKDTGTVVTVVEGRVAAIASIASPDSKGNGSPGGAAPEGAVFLDAGQQITLDGNPNPQSTVAPVPARLEPSGIEAATAWTQRRLIFKGAPLSEVVSEFNRYSERHMVIVDAQIEAIPISGSFSSSDPADLLRFLREVGAYNVRETPSAIEISRR